MVQMTENLTTKRYQGRKGAAIDLIGIHTMEAPEGPQTAENVANYFKKVNASAHVCVDNNSRVRVVRDADTAWTLPGANNRSLNIELAGYAKQSAADWADAYSLAELELAALTSAEWVRAYGIPIKKLSHAEIRAGHKGFVSHDDISKVYKQSSHWDPGPNFPWAYFLGRVAAHVQALGGGSGAVSPVPSQPLPNWNNEGYNQAYITARQKELVAKGYKIDVDGKLGPATRAAVTDFQRKNGLHADGIPGPRTAEKLASAPAPAKPAQASKPAKPNVSGLQRIVHTDPDNVWGDNTEQNFNALREATWYHNPNGLKFPWGKAFTQRVVGTEADGVWGNNSTKAHDATVVAVQKELKALGYDPGPIDGKWGPSTEAAYVAVRWAATH